MNLQNLLPKNQFRIFGYKEKLNDLIKLYENKNLSNKILFYGPRGIGKATLAYHLINYILSKNELHKYDINNFKINISSKTFKLVVNNTHNNFHSIELDENKKNIEISQIRQMINYTRKSTFNNEPKIILIDNIESLNVNSLNALLKVVEEPNKNTFFILIYDNNKNILETLKSRCTKFSFSLSSKKSIEITNKILDSNLFDLMSKDLINYYNTPGDFINLINFASSINLDLKKFELKNFLIHLIDNGYYKNNIFVKNNICKYIELYLLRLMKSSSFKSKIDFIYKDSINKINDMKKFNLDQESIFINLKANLFNE